MAINQATFSTNSGSMDYFREAVFAELRVKLLMYELHRPTQKLGFRGPFGLTQSRPWI